MKVYRKKVGLFLFSFILVGKFGVAQTTTNQNFISETTVRQAGISTANQVNSATVLGGAKAVTVQYFDGLGRPLQTVITQGSPLGKDIVQSFEYNNFGKEVKKYLPFVNTGQTTNFGGYQGNSTTQQSSFYNGQLGGVEADANAYSLAVIESSPLNRTLAQGAPGVAWQPNTGNPYDATKKVIKQKYETNTVTDAVKRWSVSLGGTTFNINQISTPGNYPAGELMVKITIDEHENTVKEFIDKSGQIVFKRVQDDNGWIETYYIYDDFNQLRAVIQPEGVTTLPALLDWAFADKWMFLYRYDEKGRMVMKKVPGADSIIMMYDRWNRLVLTQDGNMRAKSSKEFIFTKYDELNRAVVTGIYFDNRTHAVIRADIENTTGRFETVEDMGHTLDKTFPLLASFFYPHLLTETWYDDYGMVTFMQEAGHPFTFVPENNVTNYSTNIKGLVTAVRTRQLGTSNWLATVTYYDDKYRPIQIISDHAAGGRDRSTIQLSFDGLISETWITHSSSFYNNGILIKKKYAYDHAGRVLTLKQTINGGTETTLFEHSYNETGQLLAKKLHKTVVQVSELQKLDYGYNIRGWLTNINRVENTPGVTTYDATDLFSFELNYNTPVLSGSISQFNGNISEQKWKGPLSETPRAFSYTYDKVNRIKSSRISEFINSTWTASGTKYAEDITSYDKNGNIKTLNRYHNNIQVDAMNYVNYDGNRLLKVEDPHNGIPVGFTNGTNSGNDYVYDVNGNLVTDNNKNISTINYNFLNLPQQITVTAKGVIQYTYDAAGNKLLKQTTDNTTTPTTVTTTYYAGMFTYKKIGSGSMEPELLIHEEGRVRVKPTNPAQPLSPSNAFYLYDYFLKDHLGNVRLVITSEQEANLYSATIEPGVNNQTAINENALFNNLQTNTNRRVTKPTAFDSDVNNTKVYKLTGTSEEQIGISKVLKIMAADKISIQVKSYYNGTVPSTHQQGPNFFNELVNTFTNGAISNGGGKGGVNTSSSISGIFNAYLVAFYQEQNNNGNYNASRPRAYINYMYLDEDFKSYSSGAVQIPYSSAGTGAQTITISPVNNIVQKHGYLYVFLTNESEMDVYFDNLVINHERGPVLEENHYYPFGLVMKGISSQAANITPNKIKFNGYEQQSKEFLDGSGLEWYDYKHRFYDNQIGRFFVQDRLATEYVYYTPYQFAGNEVPNAIDLDGLEPLRPIQRYASTSSRYQRTSFRRNDTYVPLRQRRENSTFIPNQQSGSTPANIYEPAELGTGQQHTGPLITRGNTQGRIAVTMTEMVDDLRGQIERVTISTDIMFGSKAGASISGVRIEWMNPVAEKEFNKLQDKYDAKVAEIRNNNKLPGQPNEGASKEEWQKWLTETQNIINITNFQIHMLGPSPTQIILKWVQDTYQKGYKKVKTEETTISEFLPGRN